MDADEDSTTSTTNSKYSDDDESIDKKYISVKDTLNAKEQRYYIMIDKFFRSCEEKEIERMILIINGKSEISLRTLDWFVTRYSKKHKINIHIHEIQDDSLENTCNVHISYKAQLKSFTKKYFDPFRRNHCEQDKKQQKKFHYKYEPKDKTKQLLTTIGQLNFFKWSIQNKIIDYVEEHHEDIVDAMNVSNKEDKRKKKQKQDKKKITISSHTTNTSTKTKDKDSEIIIKFD